MVTPSVEFSLPREPLRVITEKLNTASRRIKVKGRIEISRERCKGCGLCIIVCPKKQIEISDDLNTKGYYPARVREKNSQESDNTQCTGCALCAITCPDVAIEVYREVKEETAPSTTW